MLLPMPRGARIAPGGVVFHCLNRGNDRRELFADQADFAAFERILEQAAEIVPMRILAYCLMPNHWHLLLWPRGDGHLAKFMHWLQVTHVRRWHQHRHSTGRGHLYQGAFKSFPVQEDGHFLTVARYVERNPLRANLVQNACDWRWSSLWRREKGSAQERGLLSEWPVPRSADYLTWLNQPQTDAEVAALRTSINRGRPFGSPAWQKQTAQRLSLGSTLRKRGRPTKARQAPL